MSNSSGCQVQRASVMDLDALVPLFDDYRQFYDQPSDRSLARDFLLERIQQNESVIFLATQPAGAAIGFTQLYPSFSSVSAARVFILNDLFVAREARHGGVGSKLLQAATEYSRSVGAMRLTLATTIDNQPAQDLYASRGWERDVGFCTYSLTL